jgi:hypothetical protein
MAEAHGERYLGLGLEIRSIAGASVGWAAEINPGWYFRNGRESEGSLTPEVILLMAKSGLCKKDLSGAQTHR